MEDIKKEKKVRKSKCCLCKKSFEKDELTIRSGKKYCKDCLEIHIQEIKDKNSDWDNLFEYICEVYKIKKPTGMMFQQIKQYKKDYNYTYIGMYLTLKYYYEIMENEPLEGSGVGIIPYFYDKAKRHYNKVYDLKEMVNDFENTEKIIKIKTKIINKDLITKKPIPLNIDWEDMNEDN